MNCLGKLLRYPLDALDFELCDPRLHHATGQGILQIFTKSFVMMVAKRCELDPSKQIASLTFRILHMSYENRMSVRTTYQFTFCPSWVSSEGRTDPVIMLAIYVSVG